MVVSLHQFEWNQNIWNFPWVGLLHSYASLVPFSNWFFPSAISLGTQSLSSTTQYWLSKYTSYVYLWAIVNMLSRKLFKTLKICFWTTWTRELFMQLSYGNVLFNMGSTHWKDYVWKDKNRFPHWAPAKFSFFSFSDCWSRSLVDQSFSRSLTLINFSYISFDFICLYLWALIVNMLSFGAASFAHCVLGFLVSFCEATLVL